MSIVDRWDAYATRRTLAGGETLFEEGDPGDEIYIIVEGQIAITRHMPDGDTFVLGYRGAGELIGEISLLTDAVRSAGCVATEPTTLLAISRDDFWRLLRTEEDFQDTVMHTLIESLLSADASRITAAASEQELFDRLASLSSEKDRLAEVMRLRQDTIRFIVHDLRNPLNVVMGALSTLGKMLDAESDDKVARLLDMAQGSAQRITTMVNMLLDTERLDRGDAVLDLEPVHMVSLAAEVAERNQPVARAKRVALVVDGPDQLPPVAADRNRIDRVLTNLVDNALKFTPPEGTIRIQIDQRDDVLVTAVDDTGPGIPADQQERIFERFAQTEEGRKARGFGLGLAFCRSVVQAHGGCIWAEDGEGGRGTRFGFTLPLETSSGSGDSG